MPIPEPNIKDKLSANMVREILRAIRSLTPIAGHGMRISRGPNGTVYNAKAVQKRADPAPSLPWTFICTVGEDENGDETRTGGWYRAHLQVGLNANVKGYYNQNFEPSESEQITGVTQTADGTYYAEVDLFNETAVLKIADGVIPGNDYPNNKVNIYIGTVEDGKQTDGIYVVPYIHKRF